MHVFPIFWEILLTRIYVSAIGMRLEKSGQKAWSPGFAKQPVTACGY